MLPCLLGEEVHNVSEGLRLRQQTPVFSCCCWDAAAGLVEQSTEASEVVQVSKAFFFSPSFSFLTGSGQIRVQRCTGMCASVQCLSSHLDQKSNVSQSAACVCVLLISRSHPLFLSPPDPTRVCMTPQHRAVCLNTCFFTVVQWVCDTGEKVTWSPYVTQLESEFVPYVLCYPGLYELS